MSRCLRSPKMLATLWVAADGRCQLCGCELDPDNWHADHIIPWSVTHRTNVHEMQALCPACNRQKGSKMNLSSFRTGQTQCFARAMECIETRASKSSFMLPTRYGKSDVMRMVAIRSAMDGLACGTIIASPSATLKKQVVEPSKRQAMQLRYGVPAKLTRLMRTLRGSKDLNPFSNGEIVLSTTIQLLQRQCDWFRDLAESMYHKTGLPLLVMIDECHVLSDANTWGNAIDVIVADGHALAMLWTATCVRADGESIPGFDVTTFDEQECTKYEVTDAGDGIHNIIDVYEGTKKLVKLKADYEDTTFKDAWDEGVLCHLSRDVIDVDVCEVTDDAADPRKLSELPKSLARALLAKAAVHPTVIRQGVRLMLESLKQIRTALPNAAALVFTGNDYGDDAGNKHAKAIRAAIEDLQSEYGMTLDCRIATTSTPEKADGTIEAFLHDTSPVGDVLLLKQMGGAGMDSPRSKVLLDLSSIRTIPSVVQRLMRVATPIGSVRVCRVITLADCLMERIWDVFIRREGGEDKDSAQWVSGNYEWVNQYEKVKDDDDEKRFIVNGADVGSYDDSKGNVGDIAIREQVEDLFRRIPELSGLLTKPELSDRLRNATQQEQCDDLETTIAMMQTEINAIAKQIVNGRMRHLPYSSSAFGEQSKQVYREAFADSGLEWRELQSITSIDELRALKRSFQRILAAE